MKTIKDSIWILAATLTAIVSLLLAGCRASFADATGAINQHSVPAPNYHFSSLAWLEKELVAIRFNEDSNSELRDVRLATLDLKSHRWHELPMPPPVLPTGEECGPASFVSDLSRLPDGTLGIAYTCFSVSSGIAGMLYQWEQKTDTLELLQFYPVPFLMGSYAFSPEMTELIQEQASGAGLSEKLHRVHSDGSREQILAHFQRANTPAWSPDGQTIAFMGTETYPGGHSSTFRRWRQIESLLHYPWDIYLMDADGDNLRIIQSDVKGGFFKWAPQGRFLSFAASHQETSGIWLLDTETFQLTRVWPYHTFYDWSPDGRQMVIIELAEEKGPVGSVMDGRPVIIDVPLDDQ